MTTDLNRDKRLVELDAEEALVLYDYLASDIDDRPLSKRHSRLEAIVDDEAQLWAFNGLLCTLEKILAEPFRADYDDLLRRAKRTLIGRYGAWPYSSDSSSSELGVIVEGKFDSSAEGRQPDTVENGKSASRTQDRPHIRLLPLEGLNRIRFRQTQEDVLAILGKPLKIEDIRDGDGSLGDRQVWDYGDLSVLFAGKERRPVFMTLEIGTRPVILWNRDINGIDEIELVEILLDRKFGFEVETDRWGDVDLVVRTQGLRFSFQERKLTGVELQPDHQQDA